MKPITLYCELPRKKEERRRLNESLILLAEKPDVSAVSAVWMTKEKRLSARMLSWILKTEREAVRRTGKALSFSNILEADGSCRFGFIFRNKMRRYSVGLRIRVPGVPGKKERWRGTDVLKPLWVCETAKKEEWESYLSQKSDFFAEPFEEWIRFAFGEKGRLCAHSSCLGSTVFLNRNGEASVCPYRENAPRLLPLGEGEKFSDLFETEEILPVLQNVVERRRLCSGKCGFFFSCAGSCPLETETDCPEKQALEYISSASEKGALNKDNSAAPIRRAVIRSVSNRFVP